MSSLFSSVQQFMGCDMDEPPLPADDIQKSLYRSEALHQYILKTSVLPREDGALKKLREATENRHKWSVMSVPPEEGQLISLLLKLMNVNKTIEIGVFTGYSLLVTALALPEDGKITAIDRDLEALEIGLPFIKEAGVEHKVNFLHGEALPILDKLLEKVHKRLLAVRSSNELGDFATMWEDKKARPFPKGGIKEGARQEGEEGTYDFAFVDADKNNYTHYHDRLKKLVRVGGLIAYDNTLWFGSVVEPEIFSGVPLCDHLRKDILAFNRMLASDHQFDISHICIGDGLTLCRRLG